MLAGNRKLLILTYHRLPAEPDPLFPGHIHATKFAQQLDCLRRYFNVLPLAEAMQSLKDDSLPRRAVSITFDDGYKDNHDVAYPLLAERGLAATFFVATGFLGRGRMWNDTIIETVRLADVLDLRELGFGKARVQSSQEKHAVIEKLLGHLKYFPAIDRETAVNAICRDLLDDLPQELMMSEENVRELSANTMEIGGHTVTHPILAKIELDEARKEIQHNKVHLEQLTGADVLAFAYPNGRPQQDYNDDHVDLLRNLGFRIAVTTSYGSVVRDSDYLQLNRLSVWSQREWKFVLRLLAEYGK